MLTIRDISPERLSNRELENQLPELYALEETVEQSDWHEKENVLNHTMCAVEELCKLLIRENERVGSYLNGKKDGKYTREYLLYLATVFHDLGKPETLVFEPELITNCPGHEEAGAEKVKGILPRFDLTNEEGNFVIELIKNHGKFSVALMTHPEEEYKILKRDHSDIFVELVLFELADTFSLSDNLAESILENKKRMISFYKKQLDDYFTNTPN